MTTPVVVDASPDAVLRAMDALARESTEYWTSLRGGSVHDDGDLVRYVTDDDVAWASGVFATALTTDLADQRITHTTAFFAARGRPWTWWVEPSTHPPDLAARLASRGFRVGTRIPRLWAALDRLDRSAIGVPGLEIRRVGDAASESAWLHAMAAGFDQDDRQVRALERMCRVAGTGPRGPWIRLAGSLDGAPVASSGVILLGGLASVINVSTVPSARRRGIGRAMTLAACEAAFEGGFRIAVLGTSDMARGIYERLGFREVGVSVGFVPEGSPP
jgi:ribosomal protein S18 acetylase RimI-like enzyme